jgi:hypothetical protein
LRGERKEPFGKGSFLSPHTPLSFSKTFCYVPLFYLSAAVVELLRKHIEKFGKEDRGFEGKGKTF